MYVFRSRLLTPSSISLVGSLILQDKELGFAAGGGAFGVVGLAGGACLLVLEGFATGGGFFGAVAGFFARRSRRSSLSTSYTVLPTFALPPTVISVKIHCEMIRSKIKRQFDPESSPSPRVTENDNQSERSVEVPETTRSHTCSS